MREIKFRAWDKVKKLMISNQLNNYAVDGDIVVHIRYKPSGGGYEPDFVKQLTWTEAGNIYLMQYTGLKDKNGVEIYEGDIVSSPSMPYSPIEYQRGSFNGVYADGSHDEWEAPLWRYTVEVTGNIYENPELLAGAKS